MDPLCGAVQSNLPQMIQASPACASLHPLSVRSTAVQIGLGSRYGQCLKKLLGSARTDWRLNGFDDTQSEAATSLDPMYRTVLEVERKFAGFAVPQLTASAGSPNFRNLQYLGQHSFADTYYDDEGRLSSKGVWLRRRQLNGETPLWEAKCRRGGSFNNSMSEEITDLETIASLVESLTGRQTTAANNFGLENVASLVTHRKSWRADKHFNIVFDSMDFGHEVGEVELECVIMPPCQGHPTLDVTAWKRKITEEMDTRIQGFMKHYHWAFRKEAPRGKLTAYFERQRQGQASLGC